MTPASKLASRLSNSDPISSSSAHRMVWLTWKTSCSTSTPSARGTRKWTIANAHHAATTSQWGSTRSCPATWWEFWEWIKMCRVLLPTDRLERALSLFPYGKARCPCRRWGRGQCWCVSGDGEKIGGGEKKNTPVRDSICAVRRRCEILLQFHRAIHATVVQSISVFCVPQ